MVILVCVLLRAARQIRAPHVAGAPPESICAMLVVTDRMKRVVESAHNGRKGPGGIRMSDVEFSNLLSELNKSASELNAGTERVNSVLASVETQLTKMNLGFEVWVPDSLSSFQISEYRYQDTELGFAKTGTDWSLAVRVREGKRDPRSGDFGWYPLPIPGSTRLLDASRQVRIKALQHIPELLEALKSKADEAAATIKEAIK
jgi:hypothetical protein